MDTLSQSTDPPAARPPDDPGRGRRLADELRRVADLIEANPRFAFDEVAVSTRLADPDDARAFAEAAGPVSVERAGTTQIVRLVAPGFSAVRLYGYGLRGRVGVPGVVAGTVRLFVPAAGHEGLVL